tara:strand:+ start:108 stop:413 length:306 start_codon:yes stop_codon:yes gene_type:complete
MGGIYEERIIPACDNAELPAKFEAIVKECQYESGHGGYSGTFAEKAGRSIIRLYASFASIEEARDYIQEHNDKWGPAMAASVPDGKDPPSQVWYIGGWCSS